MHIETLKLAKELESKISELNRIIDILSASNMHIEFSAINQGGKFTIVEDSRSVRHNPELLNSLRSVALDHFRTLRNKLQTEFDAL